MTPQDFAKAFYDHKEQLLNGYFEKTANSDQSNQSYVTYLIEKLDLNKEQSDILFQVLNMALNDTLYSILLGLDGCTSIGHETQQLFELKDEDGNLLTGELEGYAYEYFHGL